MFSTIRENYNNIKKIVINTNNKKLKIVKDNIPLHIKKKCDKIRKIYPNIACIIKA